MKPIDWLETGSGDQIRDRLSRLGFAVIRNHTISPVVVEAMYEAWGKWFRESQAAKDEWTRNHDTQAGYFSPSLSERAVGSLAQDHKEYFHIFSSGLTHRSFPLAGGREEVTPMYFDQAVSMGIRVLKTLDFDYAAMAMWSKSNLLRVLYYPPTTSIRAAPHTDVNLLTLIPAPTKGGLRFKSDDGWVEVEGGTNDIVVNVGDALEVASDGKYKSATHEVVQSPFGSEPRMSLPFFLHADPEIKLREGLTAGEHLRQRLEQLGVA